MAEAGQRVIAPDFLGCGRSDHGIAESQYAIAHHVARTLALLDAAGVRHAVMFLQDWGGPIGLGLELARPGLVAGVVLGNTFWGEGSSFHHRVESWRAIHAPVAGPLLFARLPIFLNALRLSGPPSIHDGPAWRAYTLPFEMHGGAGATLAWPRAIALSEDHPTAPLARAIWEMLGRLEVPTRFVWGERDAVFPPDEQGAALRERLPRGGEHEMVLVPGARHFVQEYAPGACADAVIAVAREAFGHE